VDAGSPVKTMRHSRIDSHLLTMGWPELTQAEWKWL
jgi:hypothetical protein